MVVKLLLCPSTFFELIPTGLLYSRWQLAIFYCSLSKWLGAFQWSNLLLRVDQLLEISHIKAPYLPHCKDKIHKGALQCIQKICKHFA